MKTSVLRYVYHHHMSGRIPDFAAPKQAVILDYPTSPDPRFGHGAPAHPEIEALLAHRTAAYGAMLERIVAVAGDGIRKLGREPASDTAPTLINRRFCGLDAAALYALLADRRPGTFLEIGSGNSTQIAHRAIADNGLGTRIVSIDPEPRLEIDRLCHEVIREPLDRVELRAAVIDRLRPGDMLFIDGSHRCLTNSDVTIFFLEILPRLPAGVLVHLHDILLPFDYPPAWRHRYYTEQYLLACWLLGGARRVEILLPVAYASARPELRALADPLWATPEMARAREHALGIYHGFLGFSFWLEIVDRH